MAAVLNVRTLTLRYPEGDPVHVILTKQQPSASEPGIDPGIVFTTSRRTTLRIAAQLDPAALRPGKEIR